MKTFLTALLACTAFYLCTAKLRFQGPETMLVFRPVHGVFPYYQVLDPDHTDLAAYHGDLPWWQAGDYILLHYTSYDTTTATWEILYGLGYHATLVGWIAWLAIFVRARLSPKTQY